MASLLPSIRTFIVSDSSVVSQVSNYLNSKAVFTRRPVPENAQYPFIVISPKVSEIDRDFLSCAELREVGFDIIVYGQNDTAANYETVERIAELVKDKFSGLSTKAFALPTGYSLVRGSAIGPFAAPTDDLNKVARAVPINLIYSKSEP